MITDAIHKGCRRFIIGRCNEEEKCTGESDRYGRTGISFDKSFKIKIMQIVVKTL